MPSNAPITNKMDMADTTSKSCEMAASQRELMSRRMADLVVQLGANVQPGQMVMIKAETGDAKMLEVFQESLRSHGCGKILLDIIDPNLNAERARHETLEELSRPDPQIVSLHEELLANKGARICLASKGDPSIVKGIDSTRLAALGRGMKKSREIYFSEIGPKDLTQWVVCATATPEWAKQVFPTLHADQAFSQLSEAVFHCMRLDEENPIESWRKHLEALNQRLTLINGLNIRELHFKGPETDLRVGMIPQARFLGGQKIAMNGVPFIANMPTEEIFTVPDYRLTEGTVRITRPVVINGTLVSGLCLEFHKGELVGFSAAQNLDIFAAHIEGDTGAHRLGEIALVGTDSRVFSCGLVFKETLFDENAASHLAIGNGFPKCIPDGRTMPKEDLDKLGCNFSSKNNHDDLMISDETTNVTAITVDSRTVPLLRNGAWVI